MKLSEEQEKQIIVKINKAIADLREFCKGHYSCNVCPMQENCEYLIITHWSGIDSLGEWKD